MKKAPIIFFAFLLILNIPPVKPLFEVFFGRVNYYTTREHGFSDSDYAFKGRTFDEVWFHFEAYKRECGKQDLTPYRTFKIQPQKVWLWGEYLFDRKYRLPYLDFKATIDTKLIGNVPKRKPRMSDSEVITMTIRFHPVDFAT